MSDTYVRTFAGHTDGVRALAFLPDGVRFVSGSADKTVKLWDSASGRLIRSFDGHENQVLCVAVSPDGKYIASGSQDRTVRVWDVSTGDQIAQLEGHTVAVTGVCFQSNDRLSSAGGDGFRVWDFKAEKLLTKTPDGPRLVRVAYSRDGTRAAAMDWAGETAYWDTTTCKPLADLGSAGPFLTAVGITPDGNRVYFELNREWMTYDAQTRKTSKLPGFAAFGSICFTPDQKLVIAAAGTPAFVRDVATGKEVTELSRQGHGEIGHAVACSSDGRHVVYGIGGQEEGDGVWRPGRTNDIYLFDLAKLNQKAPVGPVQGSLSWDVIPAKVKQPDGSLVPLDSYFPKPIPPEIHFKSAGKGRDVAWTSSKVFLHRTPGVLEPVFDAPNGLWVVEWDGKYIWVLDSHGILIALNSDGKQIARAEAKDGLGQMNYGTPTVVALDEGRIFVAGAGSLVPNAPPRGWCASARLSPDGKTIQVTRVVEESSKMPPGWVAPSRTPGLVPSGLFIYKSPQGPSVWMTCQDTPLSRMPIMRIDPQTLAVSLYNVQTDDVGFNQNARVQFSPRVELPDGRILGESDGFRLFTVGQHSVAETPSRLVADWQHPGRSMQLLATDWQYVVPGKQWLKINASDLTPEVIGPGLRVDGELVERDISYGVSEIFGLAGLSTLDGAFYRFSTDPAHPLSVRATGEVIKAPTPEQEKGLVSVDGDSTDFYGGKGIISEDHDHRITATDYGELNRLERPAEVNYIGRLIGNGDECQRIGLTSDQLNSLKANSSWFNGRVELDQSKVRKLLQAYDQATTPQARDAAARPLFEEARQYAANQDKLRNDYVQQVHSVLSPFQLKLLSYEHLTPQEVAQAKELAAKTPPLDPMAPPDLGTDGWPISLLIGIGGGIFVALAIGIKVLKSRRS